MGPARGGAELAAAPRAVGALEEQEGGGRAVEFAELFAGPSRGAVFWRLGGCEPANELPAARSADPVFGSRAARGHRAGPLSGNRFHLPRPVGRPRGQPAHAAAEGAVLLRPLLAEHPRRARPQPGSLDKPDAAAVCAECRPAAGTAAGASRRRVAERAAISGGWRLPAPEAPHEASGAAGQRHAERLRECQGLAAGGRALPGSAGLARADDEGQGRLRVERLGRAVRRAHAA
mmetsp:Transcript_79636/g.237209  ORF Transcript_79636/g.237209 Transcript_79636/m.237209 type:complete len:233 (-) Transcript_79636:333-1031(-)